MAGARPPRRGLAAWLATLALAALGTGVGAAAWAQAAAAVPEATPTAEAPADTPRRQPRWVLQGPGGRALSSEDFRGRYQLVAFGYVSCPDVCPTTMLEMQQVLAALGPRARHLQPLFISVDPQRDTLGVLAEYTRAFDDRILGLTGSAELVKRAAAGFDVVYAVVREPGSAPNAYTVDHTAGMFLVGPDGQLLTRFGYSMPVATLVERIGRWLAADGR
jgi:protein SCO1/2